MQEVHIVTSQGVDCENTVADVPKNNGASKETGTQGGKSISILERIKEPQVEVVIELLLKLK